jgi:hypothetical protein
MGMRFSSSMSAPRRVPECSLSKRAARTVRSSASGTPATSFTRAITPSLADPQANGVLPIDQRENALQQVIAVVAPAHDVQEEVQLGGRGITRPGQDRHHSSSGR